QSSLLRVLRSGRFCAHAQTYANLRSALQPRTVGERTEEPIRISGPDFAVAFEFASYFAWNLDGRPWIRRCQWARRRNPDGRDPELRPASGVCVSSERTNHHSRRGRYLSRSTRERG